MPILPTHNLLIKLHDISPSFETIWGSTVITSINHIFQQQKTQTKSLLLIISNQSRFNIPEKLTFINTAAENTLRIQADPFCINKVTVSKRVIQPTQRDAHRACE
jgi:hypothetical protein